MIHKRALSATLAAALVTAAAFARGGAPLVGTRSVKPGGVPNGGMSVPRLGTAAACRRCEGLPPGFAQDPHAGMVRVPGGTFELGSRHGYADERPAGKVEVDTFWIDRTEVTNAEFAAFTQATGYVTVAEREGGSAVFRPPAAADENLEAPSSANGWWRFERGASWRHPDGPKSDLAGRDNQPVVQVTAADAAAYAAWLGHELPTEAQWEYAARAGSSDDRPRGVPRDAGGRPVANYWQGSFPTENTGEDGYRGRAPVGCFAANAIGLHDVIGNVWEWTRDAYEGHGHAEEHCSSSHAGTPSGGTKAVIKGGSFLCSPSFCSRYRATARYPQEANLATAHVGFRTITNR